MICIFIAFLENPFFKMTTALTMIVDLMQEMKVKEQRIKQMQMKFKALHKAERSVKFDNLCDKSPLDADYIFTHVHLCKFCRSNDVYSLFLQ